MRPADPGEDDLVVVPFFLAEADSGVNLDSGVAGETNPGHHLYASRSYRTRLLARGRSRLAYSVDFRLKVREAVDCGIWTMRAARRQLIIVPVIDNTFKR